MLRRITLSYQRFPQHFWILMFGSFIDRLGGAILYPFYALYITERFSVGMTVVGGMFAVLATTSLIGNFIGGALTDRFGRKAMIIFGLVASGLSSLLLGLVDTLTAFFIVSGFVGLLQRSAGPARQAMVADLLPEEKRNEGFAFLRIVINLAVTVGPAIGGLLAARSYFGLFVADAITSIVTATIVFIMLPETKPETTEEETPESLRQTFGGYRLVLRDLFFMAFLAITIILNIVYVQINSTLSVFLRDVHGSPAVQFGYLLSLNASLVVLTQFWISARTSKQPPMLMMALGAAFYMVGFSMYGFVSGFAMFALAMVFITIGEMIALPVAQVLVAHLAPEDMRGRYMAISGIGWMVPIATGPFLAGLVLDNFNPSWVWYWAGILSVVAAVGFIWLYYRSQERFRDMQAEAS